MVADVYDVQAATTFGASRTGVHANGSIGAGLAAGNVSKSCFRINIDGVRAADAVIVSSLAKSYRRRCNVTQVSEIEHLHAMAERFAYYKHVVAEDFQSAPERFNCVRWQVAQIDRMRRASDTNKP